MAPIEIKPSHKICTKCSVKKRLVEFGRRKGVEHAQTRCRDCQRKQSREWYHNNKERAREQMARFKKRRPDYFRRRNRKQRKKKVEKVYGLPEKDYQKMFDMQRGLCAICEGPRSGQGTLHVDHDHMTGKVRGLLCSNCNSGIGKLGDDTCLLARAIAYLEGDLDNLL